MPDDLMPCQYPSRADLEAAAAELEQQLSDEAAASAVVRGALL